MGGFIPPRPAAAPVGATARLPGVAMLPRRAQRRQARAGSPQLPPGIAGRLLEQRLADLGRVLSAALDPLVTPGRPALAGVGIVTSTETPRRSVSPWLDRLPDGAADGFSAASSADPEDGTEEHRTEEHHGDVDSTVQAIVRRAQSGDAEAFGLLYDRYVELVYRYTYYRVGNPTLAEDLTSETFTRALRRISTFSWQGRDFGAWLVTIARNLIADHFKSARFRLELPTADLLGTSAERPAAGPEGQVLDSLTNAALLDAVRQLGPEQQECVVLRFLEGLTVAETALAMGKKPGAVKALQYRAVRSLGRLLPPGLEP